MSLTPTNRYNPCQICEDTSGKCRQGREDLSYWQCMTYADAKKGQIVNGFKAIGQILNGLWSQFKPDNSTEWTEQQRLEWKRENQRRQEEKARAEQELRANALSTEERDKAIRTLHKDFGLSAVHRTDLQARGLTNEAIERNLYFSITPDQKVPTGIPNNLPGVKFGEIKAAGTGYACVSFDPMGKATGWQIRIDGATENKYRWAKGEASSHLNNGELPITSAYPIELKRSHIGVCEGINKATIAANRLGQIFIGAASANFSASPEQVAEHLRAASEHHGNTQLVILYPDAGCTQNPHILRIYQRSLELIESLGYEVKIAWWGQVDKTHFDVDELKDLSTIEYISPDDFFNVGRSPEPSTSNQAPDWKKYINPLPELPEVGFHVIRRSHNELLEKFDGLETKRGQEWLKLREFTPDVTINSQYFDYDFKPGEDLAINSGLGTGKSHFTNAKWLSNPEEGAVFGGYRNCLNEQFCANGKELNGQPWYQIQQDLKGGQDLSLLADSTARIAGAVDSWIYFSPHHFDGKKVIFDEAESVAKHLNQSNTAVSYYRDTIKSRVSDALQNSSANLIADGNLRDFTVSYLEELSGKKFTKILNEYKGNRGKIYLYNGSSQKKLENNEWTSSNQKLDDYSKMHRTMMDLPIDIPIITLSDSQKKCEAWDRQLTAKGRNVFRLDSTTSGTEQGRLFLQNPAKYIIKERITAVIVSPSGESGMSIELADELKREMAGYFKYEFAFFFGVSTTDTQLQFLGRNRDTYTTKFVYVQNHSLAKSNRITDDSTSSGIFADWTQLARDCASLSLEGLESGEILKIAIEKIEQQLSNPHFKYESKVMLKESFEKEYPRLCFEFAARLAGWEVVTVESRPDDIIDLKVVQKQIYEERATAIFEAETIPASQADLLGKKLNKTQDERHQITKSRLLTKLPGIEQKVITEEKVITNLEQLEIIEKAEAEKIITIEEIPYEEWKSSDKIIPEKGVEIIVEKPAFNPDFIDTAVNRDRKLISRMESLFLLKNPEICKLTQQQKWHKRLDLLTDPDNIGTGSLPISRYRSKWLEIHTFYEMGGGYFLDPKNHWHDESPEAIAFWENGAKPENARKLAMKHEEKPCKYIGKVLEKFGLETGSKPQRRSDKTRYREYSLKSLNSLSQSIYDCVEQRINTQVTGFNFDWKKVAKNGGVAEAETYTANQNIVTHRQPDFSIENEQPVCQIQPEDFHLASPLEGLIESLPFCDSADEFAAVIEGCRSEDVQNAIALQDTLPLRKLLRQWYEALRGAIPYPWGNQSIVPHSPA